MPEFVDIWWQPALGALHVLGIAWFGAVLWTDAPRLRRLGILWMVMTGVLLFAANAERVLASTAFRAKMAILVALLLVRRPRWVVFALWIAAVFAARGIAYL